MTTTHAPLQRFAVLRPRYDCVATPCGKNGCGTRPGSGHGRHPDEWHYGVSDGEVALVLEVTSANYPATVPAYVAQQVYDGIPRGTALATHTTFARDTEQVRRGGLDHPECDYLSGKPCTVTSGCLIGKEFFENLCLNKKAVHQFEQPESFWAELIAKHAEWAADARENRVDLRWAQCADCHGEGIVDRIQIFNDAALAHQLHGILGALQQMPDKQAFHSRLHHDITTALSAMKKG